MNMYNIQINVHRLFRRISLLCLCLSHPQQQQALFHFSVSRLPIDQCGGLLLLLLVVVVVVVGIASSRPTSTELHTYLSILGCPNTLSVSIHPSSFLPVGLFLRLPLISFSHWKLHGSPLSLSLTLSLSFPLRNNTFFHGNYYYLIVVFYFIFTFAHIKSNNNYFVFKDLKMMETLDIMAPPTTCYLNNQKPSLQEGSKLSQWRLGLEPKNQTNVSSDEQPSSLGSQAHSSAGSDTDDSTHSGANSQRQSPHFVAQQRQLDSFEHCSSLGGWNVNAKSFRPLAASIGHLPFSQHRQSVVGDFSFPPPPIANSHYSAQNLSSQVESTNLQPYTGGFQSNFVPMTDQNRQKEAIDPLGIGGTEIMGVWQDPNAGLKRWQTYTGTMVWGDPEEKANLPIQRWQEFGEEDCVEMLTRLDELSKKLPGTRQGWGTLPTMDSLPAPLQRVHTHQSTGITQMHQNRPYQTHHLHHQTQNFQYRRIQTPSNRQPAMEHAAALAHFAPPVVGGPYQQQLQHNTFPQQQQMCGWNNNDGFAAFGHQQPQHRMSFAMNNGSSIGPSAAAFHSAGGGGTVAANAWMCDGEVSTNEGVDPNNVSLLLEQQLQLSSRNSAFAPSSFPFSGGDCFASVPGPGMISSIWCD